MSRARLAGPWHVAMHVLAPLRCRGTHRQLSGRLQIYYSTRRECDEWVCMRVMYSLRLLCNDKSFGIIYMRQILIFFYTSGGEETNPLTLATMA